jgi:hypothetical protein
MSNYVMKVDFFGNDVRCETEGLMVSLNDLLISGNVWRNNNGLAAKRLDDIVGTKAFDAFKDAVCRRTLKSADDVFKAVKGRNGRTMGHLYLAIYVAEQMSPDFHVAVIETFIEGKLLEFREMGGTEFKTLNAAIDTYLPGGGSTGRYINSAKLLRAKILGGGAEAGDWDAATVSQTHLRYKLEERISDYLRMGFVRDWDHLKQLIAEI